MFVSADLKKTRGAIQRSFRDCLGDEHLRVFITPSDARDGLTELRLESDRTIEDPAGTVWHVRRLQIGSGARSYLIGCRIRFVGKRDAQFQFASMLVVVDSADGQMPIARAECDVLGAGDHAQPHWHVYAAPDTSSMGAKALEKIHWAMLARWNQSDVEREAHSSRLRNENELARWLGGCAGYLLTQFALVEKAAPASGNFFAKHSSGSSE